MYTLPASQSLRSHRRNELKWVQVLKWISRCNNGVQDVESKRMELLGSNLNACVFQSGLIQTAGLSGLLKRCKTNRFQMCI